MPQLALSIQRCRSFAGVSKMLEENVKISFPINLVYKEALARFVDVIGLIDGVFSVEMNADCLTIHPASGLIDIISINAFRVNSASSLSTIILI